MKKVFKVFITKCVAAARYGESNCIFNSRIIFSFLIILNVLTIYTSLSGRKMMNVFFPKGNNNKGIFFFAGCIVLLYFLFSVIAPKRKLQSIQLNEKQIKQIFTGILAYAFITIITFSLVLSFRS